ncbi:MAG: DUF294 nucleotidyltransferase-like domain-containing protein [Bacteroidales bacterium]|nr:DUF294 nucleotidyltransferase-like domain-containing protein [Bacteroidales bacterium]
MMNTKIFRKFFMSIVLPSILTIVLFIISIYLIIIPVFEKNLMDSKKEMLSELTNTAWSLIEEYHRDYVDSVYTLKEAKQLAASRIELMRYGENGKDYFWITNMHPRMIMHPYRPELNGEDLTDYTDPEGTRLFVKAVNKVKEKGKGFINYMWQWKDDSTRIVPKLSYVKGFPEWNWIVGTGIYLDDVQQELRALRGRLLRISSVITLVIAALLFLIVKQSLRIDKRRNEAEKSLKASREKYRSLVEASTEGTLMLHNDEIIFSNQKFNYMAGCSGPDIKQKAIGELFDIDWQEVKNKLNDSGISVSVDTVIKCNLREKPEVVLSVSKVKLGGEDNYVIVCKEMPRHVKLIRETEHLASELQTSLLLMNQPVRNYIQDILTCKMTDTVGEVAKLMTRKNKNVIFVMLGKALVGVVNDSDLKKRVLSQGLASGTPVMEIMSAPVNTVTDTTLIYEAALFFNNKNISHLAVKNATGEIIGIIGKDDMLNMQHNALSFVVKEIEQAEDISGIKRVHGRIPVIVQSLLDSGAHTWNITRIVTSLTDAITNRVIELTLEEIGKPPCDFAFIVMGSEGRKEQSLATDQDNGIILADHTGGDEEKRNDYFENLSKRINKHLDDIGIQYCKGDVMAQNPKWRQKLGVWKQYFSDWINDGNPQSLLEVNIFFDFRYIYGNSDLVDELREHVNSRSKGKAVFLQHLAQNVIKIKLPGMQGGILGSSPDEDSFDIKKVIMPISGFARIYALQHQLTETNTLERLHTLKEMAVLNTSLYEELVQAYDHLMAQRFKAQTAKISSNEPVNNEIDINKLTELEISILKKIFSQISDIQTKLSFDFKGTA